MKRTLAITSATVLLALSLVACGANRYNDGGMPDTRDIAGGTTATDTMRNDNGQTGTGTTGGATANTNTANTNNATNAVTNTPKVNNGLGALTGAVNSGRDSSRYTATSRGYDTSAYAIGGPNSSVYTATNNGGMTRGVDYGDPAAVKRAAAEGDRFARMLENAYVHDRDGMLFDGENTSYRTY